VVENEVVCWHSLLEIFERTGLLTKDDSQQIALLSAQNKVTPGEFLYDSKAMPPMLVRAGILAQLLLRDELVTLPMAMKALQAVANTGVPFENALTSAGWSRQYFEHTKLCSVLLVQSNSISKADRDLAMELSLEQRTSFLRVILERRMASQAIIDALLNLESLVASDSLSIATAIEVLLICQQQGDKMNFSTAMAELNLEELALKAKARLGELLVASNLVSQMQLLPAVEQAILGKMRLGDALVARRLISPNELAIVLDAQSRIHRGAVTVDEAVQRLKQLRPQPVAPPPQPQPAGQPGAQGQPGGQPPQPGGQPPQPGGGHPPQPGSQPPSPGGGYPPQPGFPQGHNGGIQ
jgi:hypothetical protein